MSTLRVNNITPLSGSSVITISGSLQTQPGSSFTGSLDGTASYALIAGYVDSTNVEGPYGMGSIATASYAVTSESSSYATTASYALNGESTDTGSLLVTASVSSNTLTFTKGNGDQFALIIDTGSATTVNTSSFATTGSNTFVGTQTISGSVTLSGSINFIDGSTITSLTSSSGDGYGYTTMILTPDTSLTTDQYIVLDPTTPNHIHIRAGGMIDSSSAYLYLGGEKANVVVQNLDGSFNEKYWVQINSQTGSTQSTWVFDDNGSTIFPSLTTPRGDVSNGDLTTNTLRLGDGTDQAVISTPDGTDANPSSQRLVINPGQGSGSSEGGDIYLWAGRGGVEGGSGGDVKVRGGYGPVTGGGGYVRIEGGDTTDGTAGFVEIKGGNSSTAAGGDVDLYGGFGNSNTQNGNVTINTYDSIGSIKTWVFDTSGSLSVPGTITGASNLATTGSNTFNGDQITSGSVQISGSLVIPISSSLTLTGSMYVEPAANKLWIYTGNGGIDGWVTSSLG